ncbi:hypothetical protein NPIL_264581 [Nephila pilipes]|uniref:Uncharacterized protein n=1 Tax=Nephila pilipes TaxID=299642 RepID=A0A8X6QFF5_NEPPI|nr:hypothetical protein NPIL_264581 [Nephila pilipes]
MRTSSINQLKGRANPIRISTQMEKHKLHKTDAASTLKRLRDSIKIGEVEKGVWPLPGQKYLKARKPGYEETAPMRPPTSGLGLHKKRRKHN